MKNWASFISLFFSKENNTYCVPHANNKIFQGRLQLCVISTTVNLRGLLAIFYHWKEKGPKTACFITANTLLKVGRTIHLSLGKTLFPRHEILQISKTPRVVSRQNSFFVQLCACKYVWATRVLQKIQCIEKPWVGVLPALPQRQCDIEAPLSFHYIILCCSAATVEEKIYFLSPWLTDFQSQLPATTEVLWLFQM